MLSKFLKVNFQQTTKLCNELRNKNLISLVGLYYDPKITSNGIEYLSLSTILCIFLKVLISCTVYCTIYLLKGVEIMYIGEIIKEYRINNGLSQRAFASRTSLSPSYINTLEKVYNPKNGKPYSVTTEVATEIASAMNMSIEELLSKINDSQEFTTSAPTSNSAVVFVYSTIPAGVPMECIEDIIDTEEIPSEMLKGGKQYFGLKIKGNSMYPDYLDGDTIILEKVDDCESGNECCVMVNGSDGTFKKVIKNENGIILQPLNSEYQPMFYTNEQIKSLPVRIIGKVVELRRKK